MNEDSVTVDDQPDEPTALPEDDGFLSKNDLFDAILTRVEDAEMVVVEAVEEAVDVTIATVIVWLSATGHRAKAEILRDTFYG